MLSLFNAFLCGILISIAIDNFAEGRKGLGWFALFASVLNGIAAVLPNA